MKTLLLALVLCLSLAACGGSTGSSIPGWSEQYDLGVRYLSDGNYAEAILAFTAAIEIDPKQPDAYVRLAEVHVAQGNREKAEEILTQAELALGQNDTITTAWQDLLGIIGRKRTENEDGSYSIAYDDAEGNYYWIHYWEGHMEAYGHDPDGRRIYERRADDHSDCASWYDYDGTQVTVTVTCYRDAGLGEDGPATASCTYTVADPSHVLSAHGNGRSFHRDYPVSFASISIQEYTADWKRYAEAVIDTEQSTWPGMVKCTYSGTQATLYVLRYSNNLNSSDSKTLTHTMQAPENSLIASHCPHTSSNGTDIKIEEIIVRECNPIGTVVYEEHIEY